MTSLIQTLDNQLTSDQVTAFQKIESFLTGPNKVFMLKGYAGTGKTTLIKGLISWLRTQKKEFMVLAPTGRAAKVLRNKTGSGVTIHRGIYNLDKLESVNPDRDETAEHSFHYYFPIIKSDHTEKIIIVDESSMVSNQEQKHELFTFGTNKLLDDLLTFARITTYPGNKIIFVGDPAQLPPVGDRDPLAFDSSFFRGKNIETEEFTLTQVVRQQEGLILENARAIRHSIDYPSTGLLTFDYDRESFVALKPELIAETYTNLYPIPDPEEGAVISYTNAQAFWNNQGIRSTLFPGQVDVVAGDVLLINHNNYHTYGVELYNGDIVKVVESSDTITTRSAPVMVTEEGAMVKRVISLDFRKVKIRIPGHPDELDVFIIDTLLNSIDRDLSISEMKMLYINFVIRWKESQQVRQNAGMPFYKVGSEEFKSALKADPFYNALRVKYGYAITCHKAQGGEWKKVIVDYAGQVRLDKNALRWCYTATTRGIETVFAINAPHFGPLSKFSVTPVGPIGSIPSESLDLSQLPLSPFHTVDDHKCTSLKYWEVLEKLENTPYSIVKIESFPFRERYTIQQHDHIVTLDTIYRASGHFLHGFSIQSAIDDSVSKELLNILNNPYHLNLNLQYTPSNPSLADLYSIMLSFCADLDIRITNVIERIENYYVTYYLATDSMCSYIQFYVNQKGLLTRAIPKSFECPNDHKLILLIQELQEYANQRNQSPS